MGQAGLSVTRAEQVSAEVRTCGLPAATGPNADSCARRSMGKHTTNVTYLQALNSDLNEAGRAFERWERKLQRGPSTQDKFKAAAGLGYRSQVESNQTDPKSSAELGTTFHPIRLG
jgi:hypothetical protein